MTKINDHLRWAMRDADEAQREAMPRWRQTLLGVFGGSTPATPDMKAALTGAPTRRQALRIGGLTIGGAALIAACGSEDPETGGATTTTAGGTTAGGAGSTTTAGDGENMDMTLLLTATSLELSAVGAYQAAIDNAGALGISEGVASVATLFQAHHQEHAEALQGATSAAGGTPYEEPNAFFEENVIQPAIADLTDEASVLAFAQSLEDAAAATYVFAGSALSTPEFRQTIMSIGGVEARHSAVLLGAMGSDQSPFAFYPTDSAAPADSFVTA